MYFSVNVKSKPPGPIKGLYQAEIVSEGLQLRKKGSADILIPPGTSATCNKQATVSLVYDGTELAMQVVGLFIKNQKLAESLTGYLSQRQPAPDIKDYKLPGYLIALALMPFIIPIMTLGGGIPAGIAGGLFVATMSIAKNDDIPLALRAVYILLITVVGLIATFALLIAISPMINAARNP